MLRNLFADDQMPAFFQNFREGLRRGLVLQNIRKNASDASFLMMRGRRLRVGNLKPLTHQQPVR